MPLTRTVVRFLYDPLALRLSRPIHVHAFSQVLTNRPIGDFVRDPFPGMMSLKEFACHTGKPNRGAARKHDKDKRLAGED